MDTDTVQLTEQTAQTLRTVALEQLDMAIDGGAVPRTADEAVALSGKLLHLGRVLEAGEDAKLNGYQWSEAMKALSAQIEWTAAQVADQMRGADDVRSVRAQARQPEFTDAKLWLDSLAGYEADEARYREELRTLRDALDELVGIPSLTD